MTLTPIKLSAVSLLANDIAELLRADGPLALDKIRKRLGIASVERLQAAVALLKGDNTVEAFAADSSAGFPVLRITGDTRPMPRTKARGGLSEGLRELARSITERPAQPNAAQLLRVLR